LTGELGTSLKILSSMWTLGYRVSIKRSGPICFPRVKSQSFWILRNCFLILFILLVDAYLQSPSLIRKNLSQNHPRNGLYRALSLCNLDPVPMLSTAFDWTSCMTCGLPGNIRRLSEYGCHACPSWSKRYLTINGCKMTSLNWHLPRDCMPVNGVDLDQPEHNSRCIAAIERNVTTVVRGSMFSLKSATSAFSSRHLLHSRSPADQTLIEWKPIFQKEKNDVPLFKHFKGVTFGQ
jgi:hypothetical protein